METRQMNRMARVIGLALTLSAPLTQAQAPTPAAPPAIQSAGPAQRHVVFAHYMVCFRSTVEFYKREIQLAQRNGIDGFALNCGEWGNTDATGKFKPGNYVESAEKIYKAARELDSGFKLFFSPDMNGLGDLPNNMGDMIKRFYDHPNQFRHEGKAVISGWAGSPAHYRPALEKIKADGFQVCFVPYIFSTPHPTVWSFEYALNLFRDQPHMDGVFNFAVDGIVAEHVRNNAIGRRATQHLGKVFMAGASPAFNSPNLRDFHGMAGYSAMWEGLINDDADWVELVTWNDYNEDSALMPYRWSHPLGTEKMYLDRDESFLDLTAYYSAWYKTGVRPAITQDKIYFSYRNRSKWQRQTYDPKTGTWLDLTLGPRPFDQIHDDVEDNIYVTTFLTAPADLVVKAGGKDHTFSQPAGVSHVELPMSPGVPQFTLKRDGKSIIDVSGRKAIIEKETEQNSPMGYHLLNRTWASGAAAGPVTRLEAESGELLNGASVATIGSVKAVLNAEAHKSGFTIPVKGLKTGTYNIRIVYCNPGDTEARLTLLCDGVPLADREYPTYIPAFLPPTGKDTFRTVSFFWSLYDGTTFLSLQRMTNAPPLTPAQVKQGVQPHPLVDDIGLVMIDAIELISVDMPKVDLRGSDIPELVSIPAGEFLMGCPDGQGDPEDRPQHKVKLSAFAIGKVEVTNEQYERFAPKHRALRDEFSWRNREPVIYVSWNDAAQFCNWLNEQNGLTPADGFRLPTEAEWEYVATGRGEGRMYAWGSDAPDPSKHGNFALKAAALPVSSRVTSVQGGGTVVVGSYPEGASRDGVMDLAGNVAEFCHDWLNPYTAEPKVNPVSETPGNYRCIRGGAWNYYNYTQRATAREYNSQKYPGFTCVGFRVAISEAGAKKLQAKGK